MPINDDIRVQLAKVILEIFDVISLQTHGCRICGIARESDRAAVMDHAQDVLQNWHEYHEFAAEAFANPVLVKALLHMYSDIINTHHQAELEQPADSMQDLPRH